jgi:2-polyprenyl-3-methyl-5-hydroxy-6-metoxy-1,4-benzoquinol methylase
MTERRSLRVEALYNRNKFYKQPLRPSDTVSLVNSCPACSAALMPATEVASQKEGAVLKRGSCPACGFVTFTRMPDIAWFERFYASRWDENREDHSIKAKIEAPYGPLFEYLEPRVSQKSRVLEIGAGYGGALKQLRDKGIATLRGIEASEKRYLVCRDMLGLDVCHTTAEKMEAVEGIRGAAPYDVVFSWHVIEHVFDLDETFAAVARLLRPGGHFVIGVPDLQHEHIVYLAHFLPHIHSFTRESITRLLAKHGFTVERIDDHIRVVARKSEGSVRSLPMPTTNYPDALRKKIFRDLDLEHIARRQPFLLRSDTAMFRPSCGHATPSSSLSVCERILFDLKRIAYGRGHNLRPILHPHFSFRNALDPANVAHWLANRLIPSMGMEFGGVVRGDTDAWEADGVPLLRIEYSGAEAFAWIK